jgi:hypothetical protein
MVVEQRRRAPAAEVEGFRCAALGVMEDLATQLEPLWQQLRCGRGPATAQPPAPGQAAP